MVFFTCWTYCFLPKKCLFFWGKSPVTVSIKGTVRSEIHNSTNTYWTFIVNGAHSSSCPPQIHLSCVLEFDNWNKSLIDLWTCICESLTFGGSLKSQRGAWNTWVFVDLPFPTFLTAKPVRVPRHVGCSSLSNVKINVSLFSHFKTFCLSVWVYGETVIGKKDRAQSPKGKRTRTSVSSHVSPGQFYMKELR